MSHRVPADARTKRKIEDGGTAAAAERHCHDRRQHMAQENRRGIKEALQC